MENKIIPTQKANKPTLNLLNTAMCQFKAKYPKEEDWSIPLVKPTQIKIFRLHRFFISDIRKRGMAFYEAYDAATESLDNKELCTSVGSMLCDVYDGFRSSVEEALYEIGVRPALVWLPSDEEPQEMDWAYILVYFGCCVIMLFKNFTDEVTYNTFMSNFISELKEISGCDPEDDDDFGVPFDFKKANAIRTNLGSCSRLCQDVIRFIMKKSVNSVESDEEIDSVCRYLCNVLAWSEMRHFTLINDMLVKAKSPVFFDPRVSKEVNDFTEACRAIKSHICPQFFIYLAPKVALSKVEPSRFPTLISVAQELQRRDNNCSTVDEFELNSTARVDPKTVRDLVKLHRELVPHNRCPA